MTFANIPAELQLLPQWVLWRYERRNIGKPTKVPCNPHVGTLFPAGDARGYASVDKPATWGDFGQCVALHGGGGFDGIGFVFTAADPYCGIDIDDATADPIAHTAYQRILHALDSYTEISPSGNGIHIICRGKIVGARRHGVEAYSTGRYFTVTGNWLFNPARPIADRQAVLTELEHDLAPTRLLNTLIFDQPANDDDAAVIARIVGAANGAKMRALAHGDGSVLDGSDKSGSAIDMALVNIIQFHTRNVAQIERIWLGTPFAQSPSRCKKLARVDYRLRTIRLAFDRTVPLVDFAALQASWHAPTTPAPDAIGNNVGEGTANTKGSTRVQAPGSSIAIRAGKGKAGAAVVATPLPPAPGLLGEIADFIYRQSPSPVREIALAGAIGWMAGVVGKAYNVSGVGLNLFLILCADSGSGKEAISSAYGKIENTLIREGIPAVIDFRNAGDFSSAQALIRNVVERPSSVSLITEFGLYLEAMLSKTNHGPKAGLKPVLLQLATKSGRDNDIRFTAYASKDNDVPTVKGPAFTLLGETTPSTFYPNVTDATIADGFIPRFIIIEYSGPAPYRVKNTHFVQLGSTLLDDIKALVVRCLQLNAPALKRDDGSLVNPTVGPLDVELAPDVSEAFDAFNNACVDRINGSNAVAREVWTRIALNALKLAAIVTIGNGNLNMPVIRMLEWEWAKTLVLNSAEVLLGKIETGEVGGGEEQRQYADLMRCLREIPTVGDVNGYNLTPVMRDNGIVNATWLNARPGRLASFRGEKVRYKQAMDAIVARAISEGVLTPLPANYAITLQNGIRGTCYLIDRTTLA